MGSHEQFNNMVDLERFSTNQHSEKIDALMTELKEALNVTAERVTEKELIAIIHHPQNKCNKNMKLMKGHVMAFIRDHGLSTEDEVKATIKELTMGLKRQCKNNYEGQQ